MRISREGAATPQSSSEHPVSVAACFPPGCVLDQTSSQERAPTSVAYAETQSMFLDSLVDDADWKAQYARDRDGKPMPFELVQQALEQTAPFEVFTLRAMIAVPYFEKALYELSEEDIVNREKVIALADEVNDVRMALDRGVVVGVVSQLGPKKSYTTC